MADIVQKTVFQYRRGSAAEWASVNPILREGEPGWDTTNKKQKVGDGVTPWNDLKYQGGGTIENIDIIDCGNANIV